MLKKIDASQLKVGMYIHDLSCDWMTHPFVRNRFLISSDAEIRKIRDAGIHDVVIDSARGLDVQDAPTLAEAQAQTEAELTVIAATPVIVTRVSLGEELQARGDDPPPGGRAGAHGDAGRAAGQGDRAGPGVADGAEHHRIDPAQSRRADGPAAHQDRRRLHLPAFGQRVHLAGGVLPLAQHGRRDHLPGRAGRAAARYRQGAGAGPDPQQAGPADGRGIRGHQAASAATATTSWCKTPGIGPIPLDITLHHHERRDGSGYPDKQGEGAISELAQMAAIVDVYDAITADRCYHKGMSAAEALRKIYEWSKFHFNPAYVQEFMRCVGIYPVGTMVMLESGRLGVVDRAARDQPAGAEGQRVLQHQEECLHQAGNGGPVARARLRRRRQDRAARIARQMECRSDEVPERRLETISVLRSRALQGTTVRRREACFAKPLLHHESPPNGMSIR